jgi:hypothetical protein
MKKQSHVIILTIFLSLVLHTCHYIICTVVKLDSDDHYIQKRDWQLFPSWKVVVTLMSIAFLKNLDYKAIYLLTE